jgi:quercetin dioxygenase-like cupin family protein
MKPTIHNQEHLDQLLLYALRALPPNEMSVAESRISACVDCQSELEALRPVIDSFVGWPTDILRPAESLWRQVAEKIASEAGTQPFIPSTERTSKFDWEWEEAAPGIHVKILAEDTERESVSILVRLDPGTDYPPHTHGGVEELHLLHGELKVDDRTMYPGDFIHAEKGSTDRRVWSDTGCTCLLITSTNDLLLPYGTDQSS